MLISEKEDSKTVLASTSVLLVERAPKNGCCQFLCPEEKFQLPLASSGGSPRSASESDPGHFQITVPALGLRACEIWDMSFKNKVSISYRPPAPQYPNQAGLQSLTFLGLPGLCISIWVSDTLLLGKNLCNCDYSPFCVLPTQGSGS